MDIKRFLKIELNASCTFKVRYTNEEIQIAVKYDETIEDK